MILRLELAETLLDVLAVIVADLKTGKIVFITHVAEQLFGYSIRNSLVGICVDELVPDDRKTIHAEHRKEYEADPRVRSMGTGLVLQGKKRDGSLFPVRVTLTPTMLDGEACVVAVVADLSALPMQEKKANG